MTERPILFSEMMVRAILYGKKTQTRRLAFRGKAGDRLWVRETCRFDWSTDQWLYGADNAPLPEQLENPTPYRWPRGVCPSIHMPKWAARIWLRVTDIKVERLQDISCADAFAEGVARTANSITIDCDTPDPRRDFRRIWDDLNAKRGAGWNKNPAVYVIKFERIWGE